MIVFFWMFGSVVAISIAALFNVKVIIMTTAVTFLLALPLAYYDLKHNV